jgi:hypothetical protein
MGVWHSGALPAGHRLVDELLPKILCLFRMARKAKFLPLEKVFTGSVH